MHETRWRDLFRLAGRQHQVVTVAQAIECGIPRSTFFDNAHRLGLVHLGGGAWAQCGSPNTYRRKLWVVKLNLGEGVVFTGRTALWLRRIVAATPDQVDVFASSGLRQQKGRRALQGAWVEGDVAINVEGFQTTPVYRAFSDAASVVPLESLMRWIPAMDRLRLGTLDGLAEHAATRGRFPGCLNMRAAVAALNSELPHSGSERYARKLLRAGDLAPHPRPYAVKAGGATIAEVDLAYPRALYGAEVDGPHHRLPEVARADKARDRKLARVHWTIDRFTTEEIEGDPAGFVREVRRGLAASRVRISGFSAG